MSRMKSNEIAKNFDELMKKNNDLSASHLKRQHLARNHNSSLVEKVTGLSDKGLIYIFIIIIGVFFFKLNKKFETSQGHLQEVTEIVKNQEKLISELKLESSINIKKQELMIEKMKAENLRRPASNPAPISIINNIGDSPVNREEKLKKKEERINTNFNENKYRFEKSKTGLIEQFFLNKPKKVVQKPIYKEINLNYYLSKMKSLHARDHMDRLHNYHRVKNQLSRDLDYNFKLFSKYNLETSGELINVHKFLENQTKKRMDFSRRAVEYYTVKKISKVY